MDSTPARSHARLDSFVDRYAARTAGMTASEIRALFAVASRTEVVSLAGGMPNITGLPLDVVMTALDADVIKTYVELGLGVGIIAAMAFNAERDKGLQALEATSLFAPSTTRLAVRSARASCRSR